MQTGKLTPKSNDIKRCARYSGSFGPQDGFGSILEATVNTGGEVCLSLIYKTDHYGSKENIWGVMLTNEQRKHLSKLLASYEPTLWEEINE